LINDLTTTKVNLQLPEGLTQNLYLQPVAGFGLRISVGVDAMRRREHGRHSLCSLQTLFPLKTIF